ncbi:hypothetical protein BX661DRAFT_59310 [Kickxella alabastrina]|uniref:uncharacterized protein n=1 Tax=Kickxella alabastrina TaxID=61397 RepID=UPI00221EDCE7|nr:uncharacterized protein BX661DRAFT_59310 [Kickxella alabastrina]KAI7822458.1 hypothetical protein BX661DRAFT_59310 [Kickxella alabastrina]
MLSPFQTLPEHIIRTITSYFHHHPTRQAQTLQTYTKPNHQLSTTHQLLSSSQRWRTAALSHILGTITIIIQVVPGQQLTLDYDNWAYPRQEFPLWLAQRFVRYIRVNADYAGICQGAVASALKKHLMVIPEGFFKTRRLEVTVTGKTPYLNTVSGVSLQEALLNADKFMQAVHQLSPNSTTAGFNIHIHQPNTHLNKTLRQTGYLVLWPLNCTDARPGKYDTPHPPFFPSRWHTVMILESTLFQKTTYRVSTFNVTLTQIRSIDFCGRIASHCEKLK